MHPLIGRNIYFFLQYLRREPVIKVFKELQSSQWLSEQELQHLQFRKLKRLIHFASENVDFYKKLYNEAGIHPEDIKNPSDVKSLPIVDRGMIQSSLEEFIGSKAPFYPAKTAGTTGQSLTINVDNVSWAYHHANMFRTLSWYGIGPRDPEARIWGRRIDAAARRKTRIKDFLFNRIRLNAFDIDREALSFAKKIKRFKPHYIYGYPSAICQFIDYLKKSEIVLPPLKVVACSADHLSNFKKQFIEEFFNTKVTDIYGAAEVGVIASQCPEGGRHIPIESIWVDVDKEEEIAQGIKAGDVIVTDLNNYTMPIIRYSIGDRGFLESASCPCGRKLPLFGEIQGREMEFIKSPDGRKVNSVITYYLFKGLEARGVKVKQYQLVQEKLNLFTVKLVLHESLYNSDQDYLVKTLKSYIGDNIQVSIREVDHIPISPSGKHHIFIKETENGTVDS